MQMHEQHLGREPCISTLYRIGSRQDRVELFQILPYVESLTQCLGQEDLKQI